MDDNVRRGLMILGGALMGAGLGYILAEKQLEREYAEYADAEIESVKSRYKLLRKEPPLDTPESAAKSLTVQSHEELLKEYQPDRLEAPVALTEDGKPTTAYNKVLEPEPERVVSIFDKAEDSEEDGKEDPVPQIITVDEFMEDYHHYEKITLTYHEPDQVLLDERDQIIANVEQMVGESTLQSFGEDSGDENVVYVRNDSLSVDFEVVRRTDSYAETVLGVKRRGPSE